MIFRLSALKVGWFSAIYAAWKRLVLTRWLKRAAIREKAKAENVKPENQAEQLARLKKEHKCLIAEEEAAGILTGDVAYVRNERQRNIDQLEMAAGKK